MLPMMHRGNHYKAKERQGPNNKNGEGSNKLTDNELSDCFQASFLVRRVPIFEVNQVSQIAFPIGIVFFDGSRGLPRRQVKLISEPLTPMPGIGWYDCITGCSLNKRERVEGIFWKIHDNLLEYLGSMTVSIKDIIVLSMRLISYLRGEGMKSKVVVDWSKASVKPFAATYMNGAHLRLINVGKQASGHRRNTEHLP